MKKEVIGLLIFSLLLLLSAVFLSSENPNFFGSIVKIGDVVYNLSMAYVASFIFYFLVVFLPDRRSRKSISPYIQLQTNAISGKASAAFEAIRQVWGHSLKIEDASADDLTRMLACIEPYQPAPMVHPNNLGGVRQANWIEYFASAIRETRIAEEKILSHSLYVDVEIVKHTRAITSCSFFSAFELIASVRQASPDLSVWGPQVFEWMKLCQTLKEYADREIAP